MKVEARAPLQSPCVHPPTLPSAHMHHHGLRWSGWAQVGDLDIPASADPYDSVPLSVVDSVAHQQFARQLVAEGTVLLHNANALPLTRGKTYLVIGPSADDISVQAHTYHGV